MDSPTNSGMAQENQMSHQRRREMLNKKAEHTKKCRERKRYEQQIELLRDDRNQKKTCVWTSSMVDGYWKEVTQMKRMGKVSKVVVRQGKHPIFFMVQ